MDVHTKPKIDSEKKSDKIENIEKFNLLTVKINNHIDELSKLLHEQYNTIRRKEVYDNIICIEMFKR